MSNILYRKGYKYQLAKTYAEQTPVRPPEDIHGDFYEILSTGLVVAKMGYAWDGASGPTIDTRSFMRGSLVHDILYQAIGEGRLALSWRPTADRELYRICREDGMWKFRAHYVLRAVRKLGGVWRKTKKIRSAPKGLK